MKIRSLLSVYAHAIICIQVSSFSNVVQVLQLARQELGELLSAYEYMDQNCIDALLEVFPQFKST